MGILEVEDKVSYMRLITYTTWLLSSASLSLDPTLPNNFIAYR